MWSLLVNSTEHGLDVKKGILTLLEDIRRQGRYI
jgi:hypothetical protein